MSEPLPFIPFNRATAGDLELSYMAEAIRNAHLTADGPFTARSRAHLEALLGSPVLLVQSCTAALEIALRLCDLEPGDEVVLPSFTFASTANAVVLAGGVPVFVDIRPDTLNLDERLVEAAITPRTRAIIPVHYAGMGCDMVALSAIAERHDLRVIEDAAQALHAERGGTVLGTSGALGALSFHETKNITCGEGGALVVNDPQLVERAEILREKGTDRSRFIRGQVDKYTWVDVGSSYALSDLNAAFLLAQLEQSSDLTRRRLAIWDRYHAAFEPLEHAGSLRRPVVPVDCTHNAHMYYLLLPTAEDRDATITALARRGVNAVFHYVPLHDAPAGRAHGRAHSELPVTARTSRTLLRLPLWPGMTDEQVNHVATATLDALQPAGALRSAGA